MGRTPVARSLVQWTQQRIQSGSSLRSVMAKSSCSTVTLFQPNISKWPLGIIAFLPTFILRHFIALYPRIPVPAFPQVKSLSFVFLFPIPISYWNFLNPHCQHLSSAFNLLASMHSYKYHPRNSIKSKTVPHHIIPAKLNTHSTQPLI